MYSRELPQISIAASITFLGVTLVSAK